MFRKAVTEDLDAVAALYDAIHDKEEAGEGCTGWIRGVYPTRKTALDALEKDVLFVETAPDGTVVASARIDRVQVPVYADAAWSIRVPPDRVMVMHTLVVDPSQNGKGYGKAFALFYEDYARENACQTLRIDTNERNDPARAMYRKLGYTEVSILPCTFNGIEGVRLVCLEKILDYRLST